MFRWNIRFRTMLVSAILGGLLGCSTEKSEFLEAEAALAKGDLAAAEPLYEAFVAKYPDSQRRMIVERQLDKVRFIRLRRDSSVQARASGRYADALRLEESIIGKYPSLGDTLAVMGLRKAIDSLRTVEEASSQARLAEIDSRIRFLGLSVGMSLHQAFERASELNNLQRDPDPKLGECSQRVRASLSQTGRCEFTHKAVTLGSYESLDITIDVARGSVSSILFRGYSTTDNLRSLVANLRNRLGNEGRREEVEVSGVKIADNCAQNDVRDLRCSATRWVGRRYQALLVTRYGVRGDGDPFTSILLSLGRT